jgi:5-methylcytosine-specific restriction endonuclease McrA
MARRNPLRRVSAKKMAEVRAHDEIRLRVFARDDYTCQWPLAEPACWGPLSVHHLRKASQGGKYTEENLTTLCVRHNDHVEDEPALARSLGLVR